MNANSLRGIEANFGLRAADTFHRDLRVDYILANLRPTTWLALCLQWQHVFHQPDEGGRVDCMVVLPGQLF